MRVPSCDDDGGCAWALVWPSNLHVMMAILLCHATLRGAFILVSSLVTLLFIDARQIFHLKNSIYPSHHWAKRRVGDIG